MPNIKIYGIVKNPNVEEQRIAWEKIVQKNKKTLQRRTIRRRNRRNMRDICCTRFERERTAIHPIRIELHEQLQ